jgi:hypothetical protein
MFPDPAPSTYVALDCGWNVFCAIKGEHLVPAMRLLHCLLHLGSVAVVFAAAATGAVRCINFARCVYASFSSVVRFVVH